MEVNVIKGKALKQASVLDLSGLWYFALDEEGVGLEQHWEKQELSERIQLPGCIQAQGYGNPVSTDTPWISGLFDSLWYLRKEYQYAQDDMVRVPFLSQPPRHYTGKAWYQKKFTISKAMAGKWGKLFFECTRWKTTVWLDGQEKGSVCSLCAPHSYELGVLDEGEHTVSVCIDNGWQLPYRPDSHTVSDGLGATWNGIGGRILIELLPSVHIGKVRVFPNIHTMCADVEVTVHNYLGHETQIRLEAGDADRNEQEAEHTVCAWKEAMALEGESVHQLTLRYPKEQGLWDEFDHNQARIFVSVADAAIPGSTDKKEVRFGFREACTKNGKFYINGRPTYLRGTHFGGDYPMTGIPDCSAAFWDKIMNTVREWGMNFIRCHSYCPPEAAFAAADRAGIYLQIECGMWNVFEPGGSMKEILWEETNRILDAFGNHPSFLLLSPSNEPGGNWAEALSDWTKKCKKIDSRHLYTMQSGWAYPMPPAEIKDVDYVYFHRSGFGPLPNGTVRGIAGWNGGDYQSSLEGVKYPVICHELGQWCSYPDYRVIEKFKGYLRPGNFEVFRASAKAHDVLHQNAAFVFHSGRQQIRMLKEDLEANERTPHIYGYELLDLHDYLGQGTALVGILDAFWDSKGYIEPREWREFCNETVILARIQTYVIDRASTDGGWVEIPVEISHFGKLPLVEEVLTWSLNQISEEEEKTVRAGYLEKRDFIQEKNQPAGSIFLDLNGLEVNKRYSLRIILKKEDEGKKELKTDGGDCLRRKGVIAENHWELWICDSTLLKEKAEKPKKDDSIWQARSWKEAKQGLDMGRKVLFSIPFYEISYDCPPVCFHSVFWNAQMGPTWGRGMGVIVDNKHPVFAGFDTASDGGWQWERLIDGARGMRIERLSEHMVNLVCPIDEWNRNNKMSLLMECRVGEGKLMLTTMDLDREPQECPEAAALKQSILNYMESDSFQPEACCFREKIEQILSEPNLVMSQCQISGYAENMPEQSLQNCLDGNPQTYCRLTGGFPYYIVTQAPKKHRVKGILYMPRQDHREHEGELREYRVEVMTENGWKLEAEGELPSSFEPKRIFFENSVLTDAVRLTAVSSFEKIGQMVWKRNKDGWYQEPFREQDSCFSISVFNWILEEEEILHKETKREAKITQRSATEEIDW